MFVKRKTMEAAVEAQREIGARAVMQLTTTYGDALRRCTAIERQLTAWITKSADGITPQQMAQMFYSHDDSWQADFFNCMQAEIVAYHAAQPPTPRGQVPPLVGVPAGEGQWWHMAKLLDDSGFETLEAMSNHALYHRVRAGK